MAKYIVSMTAPFIRECEIVAEDIDSAIQIAASELVKMLDNPEIDE